MKILIKIICVLMVSGAGSAVFAQPGGGIILDDNRYVPPNYTVDQNGFDLKVGFVRDTPLLSIGGTSGAELAFSMRRMADNSLYARGSFGGQPAGVMGSWGQLYFGDRWRFSNHSAVVVAGSPASNIGPLVTLEFGFESVTVDKDSPVAFPSQYIAGNVFDASQRKRYANNPSTGTLVAVVPEQGGSDWNILRTAKITIFHRDGRKIFFDDGRVRWIEYPDGVRHTYHYKTTSLNHNQYDAERERVQSITSNTGYMIHFEYAGTPTAADLSAGNWSESWLTITKATAINTSLYSCSPTANQCSDSQGGNWRYVRLNGLAGRAPMGWDRLTSVENRLGERTSFRYVGLGAGRSYLAGVTSPQDPSVEDFSLQISYNCGDECIGRYTATIQGATWTYSIYSASHPSGDRGVVSGPDGYSMSWNGIHMRPFPSVPKITRIVVNGRVTTCPVDCSAPYSKTVTLPGGMTETVEYSDDRGSIVKHTIDPEPGSSDSAIVQEWFYPTVNDLNKYGKWRSFTKPARYKDWRGHSTNHVYDDNHGQERIRTLPAPGTGLYAAIRPQARIDYGNVGGNIYKPEKRSSCASSASCANQATERVVSLTYTSAHKQLDTVTIRAGDGGAASTTKNYYTIHGDLSKIDGPLPGAGDTTHYYYDAVGRLRAEVGPDPDGADSLQHLVIRNTYNADGNVVIEDRGRVSNPANWNSLTVTSRTKFYYDDYGRKIREEAIHIGGTQNGQIGRLTQYNYDDSGRVKCVALRMNPARFSSPPADACALGAQSSDYGPDRITRTYYTSNGEVERIVEGLGTPLQRDYRTYSYYADGQVEWVKDAKGNLTTYEYDGFNRLKKVRFPSKTTADVSSQTDYESYAYDASGNRTSLRKRDGRVITYAYDDLNRMVVKNPPNPDQDVHYGYDLHDFEIYARFGSVSGAGITNAYDAVGRLKTATSSLTNTTVSYDYDAAGNRTLLTHPDSRAFAYDYDNANRLEEIRDPSASWINQTVYDPAGRIGRLKHRDRFDWVAGYDGLSRLSSFNIDAAFTPSDDLAETFAFTPASQLKMRTISNADYQFQQLGPNQTVAYNANGLNQYDNIDGGATAHDANGNMTDDGVSVYAYDIENRLISATTPDVAVTLKYDPYGRLYEVAGSAVTRFVYDGDALIMELDGSNNVLRRYVHGDGVDDPLVWYEGAGVDATSRRDLAKNYQGSVIGVAAAGSSIEKNTYDSFGVPDPQNTGRFAYTGQTVVPELGLYYYKARIYSPHIGRFLQTDPIGYEDQMNLYAYVGNDPVNYIDPDGRVKVTVGASIRASFIKGGTLGGAVSFDTNGMTLSLTGQAGVRAGVGAGISLIGEINESGDFAKSDISAGVSVDGEAGAGFAKATAEAGGGFSVRDGFTGDAGVDSALGAEAILDGVGDITGGTLDGNVGASAGVTGSVSVSVSGTEITNAINDGINFLAEEVVEFEESLRPNY